MGQSKDNTNSKGTVLYALQPDYTAVQREWLKEHYTVATKPGKKLYEVVHKAITVLRDAELWTEDHQAAYQDKVQASLDLVEGETGDHAGGASVKKGGAKRSSEKKEGAAKTKAAPATKKAKKVEEETSAAEMKVEKAAAPPPQPTPQEKEFKMETFEMAMMLIEKHEEAKEVLLPMLIDRMSGLVGGSAAGPSGTAAPRATPQQAFNAGMAAAAAEGDKGKGKGAAVKLAPGAVNPQEAALAKKLATELAKGSQVQKDKETIPAGDVQTAVNGALEAASKPGVAGTPKGAAPPAVKHGVAGTPKATAPPAVKPGVAGTPKGAAPPAVKPGVAGTPKGAKASSSGPAPTKSATSKGEAAPVPAREGRSRDAKTAAKEKLSQAEKTTTPSVAKAVMRMIPGTQEDQQIVLTSDHEDDEVEDEVEDEEEDEEEEGGDDE